MIHSQFDELAVI